MHPITRSLRFCAAAVVALLLAASCGSTRSDPVPEEVLAAVDDQLQTFPVEPFGAVDPGPVPDDVAASFQRALEAMAAGAGMSATVLSSHGTWTGSTGSADGTRPVGPHDQFAIASITKSIVAAQVLQLVEAGELSLEDLAADHLPADLDDDANGATIRQLLAMRSGIADPDASIWPTLATEPGRRWTPAEVLDVVDGSRRPAGATFEYSNAGYLVLGLVVEAVRGRPLAGVLRDGVLAVDGIERLVYQPDERPTEPMAMPDGRSAPVFDAGGGYLPSIASVTSGGPAAAMASDAPALARWWHALCGGELLDADTITEMTDTGGSYGLGVHDVAPGAVGHTGSDVGFGSWAACLPEEGAVVVVLVNRQVDDLGALADPLVAALRSA